MKENATKNLEEVDNISQLKETNHIGQGNNKIGYFISQIFQYVPYIPDFNNFWSLLKVVLVSLFMCIVYSFTQIKGVSLFYAEFWKNLVLFSPYLFTQLFLLYIFSPQINKCTPPKAIGFILFLNFICVYIINSAFEKSLGSLFNNVDSAFAKLGLSFGLVFFFLIYFDWRERTIHPSNIKAKLSFLQSKMHPHFLFNTLNSIMSLIKSDPDKAKKMLSNLAALLRASLKEDEQGSLSTFQDEIVLCNKYLEIEKMRLGDRLSINWNVENSCLLAVIPKLTIQPLIENSILHGIQKITEGGEINISISKENKYIKIKISNPKSLDSHNELDKGSHNNISMNNLSQRLDILFNADISFKIRDWSNFFEVEIKVPFLTKIEHNPFKV